MKLHVLCIRTGKAGGPALPQARSALLRAGWQRLHPGRPFPAAGWQLTAQGQPHLPGEAFRFSLSHAAGLSVLACAPRGRIGVDVAPLHDAALAAQLDDSFFTAAEQQALAQRRYTPLQLWTRKEAVLKAAGTGLLLDPAQAEVVGERSRVLDQEYLLYSTTCLAGYNLSLAIEWPSAAPEPVD